MDSSLPEYSPAGQPATRARDSWRARLAGLEPTAQVEALLELVATQVAAVTAGATGPGHGADRQLDHTVPWRALGVYRRTADALRGRLAAATGVPLPATLLFERPTPGAVAAFLRAEILGVREETTPARTPRRPARSGRDDDPVVIVGAGCRLPGADSPAALWDLVAQGRDVIGPLPADRGWDLAGVHHPDPDHPGTTYARGGGFLPGIDRFDATFFGIGPREAVAMDPQQRLMLEVSWEALEHAGIDPLGLRGSPTGVFTGVSLQDYGTAWHQAPAELQGHLLTGNAAGVIAGRVAYTLGLEGPALTVDTQCSASLVAVHLAAASLRAGECDLAVAGGVTLMCSPSMLVEFSRKRGLSPDGRCRPFSADADGTGWAEGAAVVVLTRLSDARARRLPVLAVIAGSAVNQDGASNGLTAPNGLSQQRLISQALASAGLRPADVDAVEAHGTGTPLGDPIEARALLAAYGPGRSPDRPLRLGSLKSNIGHAQAAAGVAGVIKMVEALRHETLPASLHVGTPTPHVDWSTGAVALLTSPVAWPAGRRPRRAAVSAFGISGTNAHLIVEEPPAHPRIPTQNTPSPNTPVQDTAVQDTPAVDTPGAGEGSEPAPVTVVLSARGEAALRAHAGRLAAHLGRHPELRGDDIAHTLAARAQLPTRAAAVLDGPPAQRTSRLARTLTALAAGRPAPGLVQGTAPPTRPGGRVALVFTGQGSQLPGMGRDLHAAYPAFARALDGVCAAFDTHLDEPLRDVMFAAAGTRHAALLDETLYTQCALFAYQTALTRLLGTAGVVPQLLLGHSVGELTAAHIAGVWTLPDAAALVAARGRLMQSCRGGAMAALGATEDEARASLAGLERPADIAAVNSTASIVVAGDPDAVTALVAYWAGRGRPTRRLAVRHAFHSAHMDPVLDAFAAVAAGLTYHPPTVPVVSALTGRLTGDPAETPSLPETLRHPETLRGLETLCHTDPAYWVRHIRETVRFGDAVARSGREHPAAYLEVGPRPTLTAHLDGILADTAERAAGGPSARHEPADVPLVTATAANRLTEPVALHTALAALHTHGIPVVWSEINHPAVPGPPSRAGAGARRPAHCDLPGYPFQRQRHWMRPAQGPASPAVGAGAGAADAAAVPTSASTAAGTETSRPGLSRYRTLWRALPASAAPPLAGTPGVASPLSGRWLLLLPPAGVSAAEVSRIGWMVERLGGTAVEVGLGPAEADADADRRRLAHRLRALDPSTGVGGILSLLALDPTPHPGQPALTTGFALTCALAQAHHDLGLQVPLWVLTRGAVGTGPGDPVRDPAAALVWGLGRSLALERPDGWGGLVDVPADLDDGALAWLGSALATPGGEDQFAVRTSALLVPRLVREGPAPDRDVDVDVDRAAGLPAELPLAAAGTTVLITGGTGALGARIARDLARTGSGRLVLASRRGPDAPEAAALRDALAAHGTEIMVRRCDTTDGEQLAVLVGELTGDRDAPLGAIVHAAGVSGPTAELHELDLARIAAVVAPKAAAERLHQLAPEVPLVLLSSISATWGSAGQAAYAAANAHLDALADARLAAGLPTVSVAYGPWADAGMGAEPARRDYLLRRGLLPIPADQAVAALAQALRAEGGADGGADGGAPTKIVTVADVAWDLFLPAFTAARTSHLFDEIAVESGMVAPDPAPGPGLEPAPGPASRPGTGAGTGPGAGPGDLGRLPAAERGRALRDLVQAAAADILGHDDAQAVETGRRFLELGLDSVASVQLSRRLAAATGLRVATTAMFEHPTVADLGDHLAALLAAQPGGATTRGSGTRDGGEQVGVRGLYRQACADGRFAAGVGVLRAAARLRPTFTTPGDLPSRPVPVTLAAGPAQPVLVCLPSMVAPSGPHTFARIALHLHGRRAVHALAHPGFGDGELLPATADLVVDLHADTIARHLPDTPVALAGYSSGGWLAHAVAARLEARGLAPAAIVLLDTWLPGDRIPEADVAEELRGIAVNDQAFALMTEAQVTAQGAYLDLFEGWRPGTVRTPIVMVRAAERMPRRDTEPGPAARTAASPVPASSANPANPAGPVPPVAGGADAWELEFDLVATAGDHQSMMNEHARSTAETVHAWLSGPGPGSGQGGRGGRAGAGGRGDRGGRHGRGAVSRPVGSGAAR